MTSFQFSCLQASIIIKISLNILNFDFSSNYNTYKFLYWINWELKNFYRGNLTVLLIYNISCVDRMLRILKIIIFIFKKVLIVVELQHNCLKYFKLRHFYSKNKPWNKIEWIFIEGETFCWKVQMYFWQQQWCPRNGFYTPTPRKGDSVLYCRDKLCTA
jgi:hypothetical protein